MLGVVEQVPRRGVGEDDLVDVGPAGPVAGTGERDLVMLQLVVADEPLRLRARHQKTLIESSQRELVDMRFVVYEAVFVPALVVVVVPARCEVDLRRACPMDAKGAHEVRLRRAEPTPRGERRQLRRVASSADRLRLERRFLVRDPRRIVLDVERRELWTAEGLLYCM